VFATGKVFSQVLNEVKIPALTATPTNLTFYASGGSSSVNVKTNIDAWSVGGAPSWCTVSKSGSSVSVTCSANTGSVRTGSFKITAGSKTETISIYQNAAETTLTATPTSLTFTASGGSSTVNVYTNADTWSVQGMPSWCTTSKYSTSASITCSANTGSARSGSFTITAGSKTATIYISQAASDRDGDGVPDRDNTSGSNLIEECRAMIKRAMNTGATQTYDGGDRYKGQLYGLGIYYWNNGTVYLGRWKNGDRTGYGIYMAREGYDVANCPNCKFYVGDFATNNKSGKGFCYNKAGKWIYYGDFADDKPTETYPMNLSSCKFECLEYQGGDKYIGETKDGKAEGYGACLWKSGAIWFGWWKDGVRDGSGIYIGLAGSMVSGKWKGDTQIE
jgi:hypothetical protein